MTESAGGSLGPATDSKNVPVIDPTKNVIELVEAAIKRQDDLREISAQHAEDALEKGLRHERDICNEKFSSVNKTLKLVEDQRVEQKQDTKAAVDAALAAAKEAVKEQTTASALSITKSENATAEQLRQMSATFTTAISGVTSSIGDLKTRTERIENIKQGGRETLTAIYALVGLVLMILTIVGIIAASGGFNAG